MFKIDACCPSRQKSKEQQLQFSLDVNRAMSDLSSSKNGSKEVCGETPIATKRLVLRAYRMNDATEVARILNNKKIASNTRSVDVPYSMDSATKLIEKQQEMRETGDAYAFAICQKDSTDEERLIGGISLMVNKADHSAELGFWLGQDFWNRGYCTEASKAIVEFGFETLGLFRVTAHHLSRNPASGRVLEKIGMTKEGVRRKHVRKWGVFEDVVLYGMISSDPRP